MQIVAITGLATAADAAAAALARALGTLPYDERRKLAAGLPAVVLTSADPARADALAATLRALGHRVIACASESVVSSSEMVSLKRFALDEDALVATDRGERLPWGDVAVLVRAVERRRVETTTLVKEKKTDLVRAVVTGGLVRSKTTTRAETARSDESEPVLYLFRGSGATPWILREQGTHYEALGARLSPTAAPNFLATVAELRARAPQARWDERLVARRVPSPEELDLLAHLVAWSVA
jgi:hypothetical protein